MLLPLVSRLYLGLGICFQNLWTFFFCFLTSRDPRSMNFSLCIFCHCCCNKLPTPILRWMLNKKTTTLVVMVVMFDCCRFAASFYFWGLSLPVYALSGLHGVSNILHLFIHLLFSMRSSWLLCSFGKLLHFIPFGNQFCFLSFNLFAFEIGFMKKRKKFRVRK